MTSAPREMPRVMVPGLKPPPSMPVGTRMPTLSGGPDWSGMGRSWTGEGGWLGWPASRRKDPAGGGWYPHGDRRPGQGPGVGGGQGQAVEVQFVQVVVAEERDGAHLGGGGVLPR